MVLLENVIGGEPISINNVTGQVRITRNWRACMNVDDARGVCKDRSWWRFVVSAYPHGKKA